MKTHKKHIMNEVWRTFKDRKDIEYSFVVSICAGMILLVAMWLTGLEIFKDALIGAPLLVAWVVFTTYFLVSVKGHRKTK